MATITKNLMIRVPEQVANRLDSVVPKRKRNQFIVDRLIEAIEEHDTNLAKIAELVNAEESDNPELRELMSEWDAVTSDGIKDTPLTHENC